MVDSSSSTTTITIEEEYGFIGQLVQKILRSSHIRNKFPCLQKDAKYVELWAHNRPHASGHQLHFDSDDEGRGGVIKNPIVSTILYLNNSSSSSSNNNNNNEGEDEEGGEEEELVVGGPSLVTNQTLQSKTLATQGWLAHPRSKRLVVFDGRVLHGVVPGKGVAPACANKSTAADSAADDDNDDDGSNQGEKRHIQRRVTLMLAFWKHIRIRTGDTPGSARPFPKSANSRLRHKNQNKNQNRKRNKKYNNGGSNASPPTPTPEWVRGLTDPMDRVVIQDEVVIERPPIVLDSVYERLDGEPWKPSYGMPDYEQVFQGF